MKLSIITICYNPGPVLRSAVDSVLAQSHEDVEYIIVDGGSSDGTVELISSIKDYEPNVHFVSEPDKGLYDALNKGVRLATGDVIGFVHADDFLAYSDVLKHVAEKLESTGAEALYGDLQYVADGASRQDVRQEDIRHKTVDGEDAKGPKSKVERPPSAITHPLSVIRHWRSGQYDQSRLRWGWMPPHPSLYLKRDVYERAKLENGEYFDTSFSCAADYDFMMRVLSSLNVKPVYLPEVLVKMRVGGVSNRSLKHILRKSAEDWRAIRRNKIGHIHTLVWKNLSKLPQFLRRTKLKAEIKK